MLNEALAVGHELEDPLWRGWALCFMAGVCLEQGRLEEAGDLARKSLSLAQAAECSRDEAVVLDALGVIALEQGDVDGARSLFSDSIRTFEQVGERCDVGLPITSFAWLAARQGQPDRAVRLFAAGEAVRGPTLRWGRWTKRRREILLSNARAALGDETFERAWAEGKAMTVEQAVEYALQDAGSGPDSELLRPVR